MFTGIVEEIGTVVSISKGVQSSKLTLQGDVIFEDMHIGDSIAVNGVCLTVTTKTSNTFTVDVMAETLRRSSLGSLTNGSKVNMERAMAANGRFGGHIVSGHIDGTGEIESFVKEDNAVWVTIKTPTKILKYIIEKGSITIDGISLTVAYVDNHCFKVSLIPHTAANTTLLSKKPGDIVNLENDIVGKYIDKLLHFKDDSEEEQGGKKESGISMDFLAKNGFTVDWFDNGADGQEALFTAPYDAVILDLGLPEVDGLTILKHWREKGKKEPVLILTAQGDVDSRVLGLNKGADDYLGKPFSNIYFLY